MDEALTEFLRHRKQELPFLQSALQLKRLITVLTYEEQQ